MNAHADLDRPRRRPARLAGIAVVAASLLVGLIAAPSAAGEDGEGSHPGPRRPLAQLRLTLTPTGGTDIGADEGTGETDLVTLTCTPDGGTHPNPKAACDSLRAVGGNFEKLPSVPDAFCPLIYDPHLARAGGYWQSSPSSPARFVSYAETFSNRCFAAVGTDNVFAF